MRLALPDVNVLVALAWPMHVHHGLAVRWFENQADSGWATCPFTQSGFVRVSSNPKIIPDAVLPMDAIGLLARLAKVGRHVFWPADIDLTQAPGLPVGHLMGHRQITDAYLLGLAIQRGGRLVTLDRTIATLLPTSSPHRSAVHLLTPL